MQGLRLGTRGSPLALAQARKVAAAIETAQRWPDGWVQIVEITTTGDKVQDRPLAEIGGKALWTKELDRALARGRSRFLRPFDEGRGKRPAQGHPHRRGASARRRARPHRRRGIDRRIEAGRGRRHLVAPPSGATAAASPRSQDRAPARQCRNPVEKGRGGRGRRDPALFRGPQAARDRRRDGHPDRDHPAGARAGGDRDRMPDQRHAHAERPQHRQQPDHLLVRDGRARIHSHARRELRVAGRGLLRARGRRPADARPIVQRRRVGAGRGARGVRLRRFARRRPSSPARCWRTPRSSIRKLFAPE